jgi:hypothetical protein
MPFSLNLHVVLHTKSFRYVGSYSLLVEVTLAFCDVKFAPYKFSVLTEIHKNRKPQIYINAVSGIRTYNDQAVEDSTRLRRRGNFMKSDKPNVYPRSPICTTIKLISFFVSYPYRISFKRINYISTTLLLTYKWRRQNYCTSKRAPGAGHNQWRMLLQCNWKVTFTTQWYPNRNSSVLPQEAGFSSPIFPTEAWRNIRDDDDVDSRHSYEYVVARSGKRVPGKVTEHSHLFSQSGARGNVVGWGTTLQIRMSRVPFPTRSLDSSVDLILPAALCPWGRFRL